MSLEDYGWNTFFAGHFEPYQDQGLRAGRVVLESRGLYRLATENGEVGAIPTGKLRQETDGSEDRPIIGDWVAIRPPTEQDEKARIRALLPRKTKLSRKVAGRRTEEQPVAANLDTVFLVMGLDGNFNARRMERLVVTARESGALPVVVLNKADLCEDLEEKRFEVQSIAPGVPVLTTSFLSDTGFQSIEPFLEEGQTIALLGSSGVGKSTLVNRLCRKEIFRTAAVREGDERGRHTTSHRQLVRLPNGALLIDNPGIRELALWSTDEGLGETFKDIEELAVVCRFRDCRHETEPGCAVSQSAKEGSLSTKRLESFRALQKELRFLALRQDELARRTEDRRIAAIHRAAKKHKPRQ